MARSITIEFLGKDKSAGKTAAAVEQRFGKLGGTMDKLGQRAGKALVVGAVAGGAALLKMGQNAAADEAAQRKLAIALRNSTFATDESIAGIEDWISKTSLATGVSDDELRPAMQRLAQATGSATEAQDQLQIAMDVSAGTGKSLKVVTEAMAKANNGSVGALSKLGLKTKDAAGNVLTMDQALAQMSSTFKGQAAAAAGSADGKMKRLGVTLDELGESIGTMVLPALETLTDLGLQMAGWVSNNTTTVGVLVGVIGTLAAGLWVASLAMRAFATASKVAQVITTVAKGVMALNAALWANPVLLIVAGIILLVGALVLAYKKSETFRKIVNAAFSGVLKAGKAVWNWIKGNWPTLLAVLTGPIGIAVLVITRNWDKIKAGAGRAKDWIVSKWNALIGFFKGIPGKISSATSGMWNGITSAFKSAINTVIAGWNNLSFTMPSITAFGKKFGGFTISTPNIPYLAKGGIIKARPGGTAVVAGEGGRDEAVIPLPRGMRTLGGGGAQIVFTGPVYGDPAAFGRFVEKSLQDWERRSGRKILAGVAR